MIPSKLKKDSNIRVISPSRSMSILSEDTKTNANNALNEMELKVSFSKHANEVTDFKSSGIESRVEDLHEAFTDKNINAVLTTIGGFNSNQLLNYIDFKLIKKHPKIICGYSDITALNNAIYAKTGMTTYLGAHYSTFGMKKENEYTKEYFKKCLFEKESFEIKPSPTWTNDAWWSDQENRTPIKNEGWEIIHEGKAKGTIIGGNLCTFILLQGTKYMPKLKNSILLIEDDCAFGKVFDVMFDRNLQSILQQEGADKIRGILIGRPEKSVEFTKEKIQKIIDSKKELNNIPVIANVDFGHTYPLLTLPIGGTLTMNLAKNNPKIEVLTH